MTNEEKFLNYTKQFNSIKALDICSYSYRFDITPLNAMLLLTNFGWSYSFKQEVYLNPDKKDPNSLIENTDFKPKEFNSKPINYRRK